MAIRITRISLSGGTGHEHITHLEWVDVDTAESKVSIRAQVVSWIEDTKGTAFVQQPGTVRANVGVVVPDRGEKYLRTYADGQWNNNLLSLPRF